MEKAISSPWLAQLKHERPFFSLDRNAECDIAVIGAGIAGVSTAYFLLKHTDANVALIEAGRIAHGATGRNAGQAVSYFERPLADIVRAFGTEAAMRGQVAIESAWGLLEDVMAECALKTPLHRCKGYAGFCTVEQILDQLKEKKIRDSMGLFDDPLLIAVNPTLMREIPIDLKKYALETPHSTIMHALETDNPAFIAAETSPKGCINGALFCEELVGWMKATHGDRLTVAEHLPVSSVVLRKNDATVLANDLTIKAKKVVLCTNGFENFSIVNEAGPDIDAAFHSTVRGTIGYMAGYVAESDRSATAVSYHGAGDYTSAYWYVTRRPFETANKTAKTLTCIGGSERTMPDRATYDPSSPFPANIEEELDRELRATHRDLPPMPSRMFLWQGLMGYTPNNLRRIGFEPKNDNLLYNLGCNGVGILPSIYGGKRIAKLLSGMHLRPSIFDPDKGDL